MIKGKLIENGNYNALKKRDLKITNNIIFDYNYLN